MKYYLRPSIGADDRRFQVGQQIRISGISFRVGQGRKADDDRVLEWLTPNGWVAVEMAAGGLLADFFYENEHVLYEPALGAMGGDKYMRFLQTAVQKGWQVAVATLAAEKAAKRTRDGDAA